MAYTVMTYAVMAYLVMAYAFMACIVMARGMPTWSWLSTSSNKKLGNESEQPRSGASTHIKDSFSADALLEAATADPKANGCALLEAVVAGPKLNGAALLEALEAATTSMNEPSMDELHG